MHLKLGCLFCLAAEASPRVVAKTTPVLMLCDACFDKFMAEGD